jgi:hypothetical protein
MLPDHCAKASGWHVLHDAGSMSSAVVRVGGGGGDGAAVEHDAPAATAVATPSREPAVPKNRFIASLRR